MRQWRQCGAIQQGAALIPALAFMIASTNLMIELGAILWVLMGWQFVLVEIIGLFCAYCIGVVNDKLLFTENLETEIHPG